MAIFSLIVILTLGLYVNIGSMMAEITTTADQNFFRTYREIITMIILNGKHQV